MSQQAADQWVKKHLQAIPVIPLFKNRALDTVAKEGFDKTELSQIIASDPGFSSRLLSHVNSKRKGSKRDYLESIQSALSLIGEQAIHDFIEQCNSLNDVRTSFACVDDYLDLVARAHHAASHSKMWASKRKSQAVKEIGIATKLFDVAEYVLCLFDHEHYQTFKQEALKNITTSSISKKIFGFSTTELTQSLCEALHFPDLIKEAHGFLNNSGIRSQDIVLATQLAKQADINWYCQEMEDCLIKVASHCQLDLNKTIIMVHQTSIKSAREIEFKYQFHAAAKLVQHAPMKRLEEKPSPTSALVSPPVDAHTTQSEIVKRPVNTFALLLSSIKKVAQNQKSSQALLLTTLLNSLHKYLGTQRNALLLLNKERTQLNTRLHSGLNAKSKLLKIRLNTAQSGLLKKLLEKPQAVWITPNNYKKYENMLPGLFKSCSLSDDFFLMSLFSANKPVGIIFCDNQGHDALTKDQFKQFKHAISLSSKAMVLLSKRKQPV